MAITPINANGYSYNPETQGNLLDPVSAKGKPDKAGIKNKPCKT
jgi:hypothetical protein